MFMLLWATKQVFLVYKGYVRDRCLEVRLMRVVDRKRRERLEHELLSGDACFADCSQGREVYELPDALRTCFQRDHDRIIHCKSFRRLANKTQVFIAPEGDHYRTRLTHTLEVSQVSCAIARSLGLNVDLTEAIALGHDLGHTPFGHAGERALRAALKAYYQTHGVSETGMATFEHNEQSVRVVTRLERGGAGLNLSREVTDGMRCHTNHLRAQTLEGRIVALADRIAYVCHDIDDAERAGLLVESSLPQEACQTLGSRSSERIATMVNDVVHTSATLGDIEMSPHVWDAMMELRSYLYANLYHTGDAKSEEPKAVAVVQWLFDYFVDHMDEVPLDYRMHDDPREVQVADYLASMTDRFAIRMYEELTVPRAWGMHRW